MQTITPFLWFEDNAEDAVNFYLAVFKNGKVLGRTPAEGKPLTIIFEVNGQRLMALNGGPYHQFNEAISLLVSCETQDEIDELWEIPVSALMNPTAVEERAFPGREEPVLFYHYGPKTVWGATARILSELLGILAGEPN